MNGEGIAQIITSIATLVGVIGGVMVSLRNGQKADKAASKIDEIHTATNGMKAELVTEVRNAAFAQGVKSETDKQF